MSEDKKDWAKEHPAKIPPSSWIWDDRSDQPVSMQVIDLLHDIRLILFAIFLLLLLMPACSP